MRLLDAHDKQLDGGSTGGGNSSAIDLTHVQERSPAFEAILAGSATLA
jgi:hypothetical protein